MQELRITLNYLNLCNPNNTSYYLYTGCTTSDHAQWTLYKEAFITKYNKLSFL